MASTAAKEPNVTPPPPRDRNLAAWAARIARMVPGGKCGVNLLPPSERM